MSAKRMQGITNIIMILLMGISIGFSGFLTIKEPSATILAKNNVSDVEIVLNDIKYSLDSIKDDIKDLQQN